MTTPIELLEQWADLQPNRCRFLRTEGSELIVEALESGKWPAIAWITESAASGYSPSLLQQVLQQAIAAHNARLRLENSADGWHATVGKSAPSGSGLEILVFAKSDEAALAMLEAWILLLNKEQS